jgi:DNA mismatch endonuclease (patch repair protein)
MIPRTVQLTKSEQMSRVRSRDTSPELLVRSLLTRSGVRYRLHRKDLPGRPDIYVARLRLAIYINGCFWHGHADCSRAALPKTNARFWAEKIGRNVERDRCTAERLKDLGVEPLYLWTCKTSEFAKVCSRIARRWARFATAVHR